MQMQKYVGTKVVNAVPMTRAAYKGFRGWPLPADEIGSDDGYLVEYLDGGTANVETHTGYVSWTPKAQFDAAYVELTETSIDYPPHQLRVVAEKAALDNKVSALAAFISGNAIFHGLPELEKYLLQVQLALMTQYAEILRLRVSGF